MREKCTIVKKIFSVFFPPNQVHAHIISYLKQEMPSVFRKDNKKKNLIYQLPVIFSKIQLQHNISAGDFPDCAKMQVSLSVYSFHYWLHLEDKCAARPYRFTVCSYKYANCSTVRWCVTL